MRMMNSSLIAAGIVALAATANGAVFTETFDTYTTGSNLQQLTYNTNYYASAGSFSVTAGAGLKDSSDTATTGIDTTSTSDRKAIRKDALNLADGAITASMYFNPDALTGNVELALYPNNNSTTDRTGLQLDFSKWLRLTNGTGASGSTFTNGSFVADNWYFLEVTFALSGTSDVQLTGKVFNATDKGVIGSQVGSTYLTTATAAAVATDSTVFVGFRQSIDGQSDLWSASQVPEPSAIAVLGLAALPMLRRRRM